MKNDGDFSPLFFFESYFVDFLFETMGADCLPVVVTEVRRCQQNRESTRIYASRMPFGPAPTSSLRLSSIAGRGRSAVARQGRAPAATPKACSAACHRHSSRLTAKAPRQDTAAFIIVMILVLDCVVRDALQNPINSELIARYYIKAYVAEKYLMNDHLYY